jgi:hypothetical protein
MTHGRRIGGTAFLFAAALVCVGLASTTHSVIPVFLAWIPLLLVPWWLTRPVVGDPAPAMTAEDEAVGTADGEATAAGEAADADPATAMDERR